VPDVKKNKAGDDTRERIETGYPGLHPTNTATVDLLYTEAKSRYDANRERSKTLDGKAGTLITIITTGFGAFAILGDPAKIGTTTTCSRSPLPSFWHSSPSAPVTCSFRI